MSLTRRTFLSGLSAMFGSASVPDLRKRVLDAGRPMLLEPTSVSNKTLVAETGHLFLGDHDIESFARPKWRQYFVDIGARGAPDFARQAEEWFLDDIDVGIDDDHWSSIYELTYDPMPAAYRLLRRLGIGPTSKAIRPRNGRLDFFAGSNHPGSSDLWVEAYDDLTVSLLQARLIELKQPIKVVMEAETITKLDEFDHESEPADE